MSPTLHASCIALGRAGAPFGAPGDAGILLVGPSGAGKSDLALRMIAAGAELVADDRTALTPEDGSVIASPPPVLAGLIEIRNVGIIQLPARPWVRLLMVADLVADEMLTRLRAPARWEPPPPFEHLESSALPLLRLDPFAAAAPAKLAAAAAAIAFGLFRENVAGG